MKISVTGASGFIGRHVLNELARYPLDVVCVTREGSQLAAMNIATRTVEMDISRPRSNDYNTLGCPDVLIHLAWDGLPNYNSLHHFETELPSQYRFLKGLIESGLPALLVTGTCFEYGMQSGALSEDMMSMPSNPYGHAKHALLRQLMFLRDQFPFKINWVRLFYMYGDGQPITALYPQLKASVLRRDRIFNMSGGEQLRDYLPISQVASFIVALAKRCGDNGVVNLCSGTPISVRRLVEGWLKENSWDIKLNLGYYPYPDYEPMAFWGNRRRLDSILAAL